MAQLMLKAIKIAEQFEVTRQFWSYLVENGKLTNPEEFYSFYSAFEFCLGKGKCRLS